MNKNLAKGSVFLLLLAIMLSAAGQENKKGPYLTPPQYIQNQATTNKFTIAANGKTAEIFVDPSDWKGVIRAANDLGDDVRKVSGSSSLVVPDINFKKGSVLVGTIGRSRIIDQLIAARKLDVSKVKGQWESFVIQTIDGNLVIAGSDKRGTIYGIYDVSEKIGVSPWYWWADAPVKKNKNIYVKAGKYIQSSPRVKYRGIFINDEHPSFAQWAAGKFGGVNSKAYSHMFELLLRLKANYLWPAMWNNAFNEDDPLSPILADEYGIVMGTSHHEPMMRAHKEYTARRDEIGAWDYAKNETNLKKFFTDGVERNKRFDNLITIGMRGDGDVALGKGDDAENIEVLKRVVKDQRDILSKVYEKAPSEIPQLWAIFTEVQRYYDAGLNVPDDVTLLFCDNNWGYIRRTGPEKEKNRKGGMGLYYHIDMNGGPWNDRWINTTTIPKLREQFNLAYQTGLDRLWIVNVGDLKPKELPIDFVMRYAWNPEAIPAEGTRRYTEKWAESIFGKQYAQEIADIVSTYPKYNLWRKPEIQAPDIFSFVNYNEADRVLKLWHNLVAKAEALHPKIEPEAKDAYYQLVLYPAKASAGVAEIYLAAGRNNLYAKQGRVSANDYALRARDLFELDKKLSNFYNDSLAAGKWKNMMQDIHIGYKQWSMPKESALPELKEVVPLSSPTMGIAVEGSEAAWPGSESKAKLPIFDGLEKQRYYIDVFNRGNGSFYYAAKSDKSWIKLSQPNGTVNKETRIYVEIDWTAVNEGESEGLITIQEGSNSQTVAVKAVRKTSPITNGHYFGNHSGAEFSIPAYQFNANVAGKEAKWRFLPDLGRAEGNMGIYPVTATSTVSSETAPRLEYNVLMPQAGKMKICLGILPTQDINSARGLRIAVSVDDGAVQILDARKGFVDTFNEYSPESLTRSKGLKPLPPRGENYALISRRHPRRNEIFDNLRWLDVDFNIASSGMHTIKVFMVDPEIVLEKIVVNPDDERPSYFGAPSIRHNAAVKQSSQN